jgi:RNA polymerase sigma-70 factor (ECF subfamily)
MADLPDKTQTKFLVLRCQVGDKEAFNGLLASVESRLFAYVRRVAGDTELAKDILQDVFLIIYRKIGWLNDPELFLPWAYRIAMRETFRVMKKKRREVYFDEETFAETAAESGEPEFEPELIERIPATLEKVSRLSREVLILHYLEGMSIAETADILDVSVGTAKSRLAYGLAQIRKIFV